jgi:hypothetical protein
MTGHPQQRRVLYFQALPWRRLREGVSDGLPLVEQAAQSGVPLWFAMLAWFNAENGDADAARAAARRIDLHALSPAERRFDWWLIVAGLAIAVHATADSELAQELYAVVLPYRDRNCTVGQTAFFGAVAHYLGLLSTTTGDYDAAVAHFDDALTRHRAMGAAPFVAMTQVAMADALAARNGPGDDAAARQLRDDAAPVIAQLELTALAAQAPSRREHARE